VNQGTHTPRIRTQNTPTHTPRITVELTQNGPQNHSEPIGTTQEPPRTKQLKERTPECSPRSLGNTLRTHAEWTTRNHSEPQWAAQNGPRITQDHLEPLGTTQTLLKTAQNNSITFRVVGEPLGTTRNHSEPPKILLEQTTQKSAPRMYSYFGNTHLVAYVCTPLRM
jgi:hypothetical protein